MRTANPIASPSPPATSRPGLPSRRGVLAALAGAAVPVVARAQAPIRVRDLLGREVELPRPARRVILGSGRYLAILNLLHPDPASLVVGWSDDLRRGQAGEYEAFRRRAPALDAVPVVARANGGMNAENLLALRPDLVILTRALALDGRLPGAPPGGAAVESGTLVRTLDEAGVPVAVLDFFQRPLTDTVPSLAVLGQLLGRVEQADAFLRFYGDRLKRIEGLDFAGQERPSVFMHAHAGGMDCCFSPGRGVFDDFIRMAGGRNIGAERIAGVNGQLGLEHVLAQDARFYIATGGPFGGRGGVSLGAGVTPAQARTSLAAVLQAQKLDGLGAVRDGRAHAIWHGFNDSPAHLVAIEAMARWFHPDRTAGIDPAATLREINGRFAAVPMDGTYWVDLAGP